MNAITTLHNWCEIDQLDEVTLKDREKIELVWPDGSKETICVRVKITSELGSEMGHTITIPVSRAFVEITHRGLLTWAHIAGLRARRVT